MLANSQDNIAWKEDLLGCPVRETVNDTFVRIADKADS